MFFTDAKQRSRQQMAMNWSEGPKPLIRTPSEFDSVEAIDPPVLTISSADPQYHPRLRSEASLQKLIRAPNVNCRPTPAELIWPKLGLLMFVSGTANTAWLSTLVTSARISISRRSSTRNFF